MLGCGQWQTSYNQLVNGRPHNWHLDHHNQSLLIIIMISSVIWIVMSNARMRSVTNYFIINLSMADIINATFNVIPNFTYMLTGNWPFGEILNHFASNIAQKLNSCFLGAGWGQWGSIDWWWNMPLRPSEHYSLCLKDKIERLTEDLWPNNLYPWVRTYSKWGSAIPTINCINKIPNRFVLIIGDGEEKYNFSVGDS